MKNKTVETRVIIETEEKINIEDMKEAGEVIRRGGLVAFPTETVYGLGANGLDEDAAAKIYAAKQRPSDNPLILHISKLSQLEDIVEEVTDATKKLMDAFWPGPLTIVMKKAKQVPYGTTGGLETVAVRMPSHKVALALIDAAGVPIAAPSANRSGRPSPTTAAHVVEDMDGIIDMIIDGGQVGIGIESTIVDMSGDKPMILRPGYITKKMIEDLIGECDVDKVVVAKSIEDLGGGDYKPKAPGMKYKHYAPKAELTMFEGDEEVVVKHIDTLAKADENKGLKVGIICTDESMDRYSVGVKRSIGSRKKAETIAHNLYGVLREFDELEVDVIYGETFYEEDMGQAIMNRLIKAAGYKLESV